MSISMDPQRNKLMHLENTLVMYGIYNAETLEKLVKIEYMSYTVDNHLLKVYLHGPISSSLRSIFTNAWSMQYSTLCNQFYVIFAYN